MCLCSKQSSLFSFHALPSDGNLKGAVVHWEQRLKFDQFVFEIRSLSSFILTH